MNKLFKLTSFWILAVFFVCSIFAPILSPFDPLETNLSQKLLPIFSTTEMGFFVFGTDSLGRDIFSRILFGGRISLVIGLFCVIFNLTISIPIAFISGYVGGKLDETLNRFLEALLALPSILVAILVTAVLGPSLLNAMIAVSLSQIPTYIKIFRAQVIQEKVKDYILADKAIGKSDLNIIVKSMLLNCLTPIIVQATLGFSSAILEAAALSFIGLGAQPPTPEWGAMLFDGKTYFHNAWWVTTFPGLAIFLVVLNLNILGDNLRTILDPKLK